MSQEEIVRTIQKYLDGDLSLPGLNDWVDDYQWSADGDPTQQNLMGLLELYLTEIDENVRIERDLRNALYAALAARISYTDDPFPSYNHTGSSNQDSGPVAVPVSMAVLAMDQL